MAPEVATGPVWSPAGPPEAVARRRLAAPVVAGTTYALAQAVLLFWWAARYPGLFSPDSLDHVWQATTGDWNTHHPISYTALVWLSIHLTGGVGALTLAQTCALAAGLAYAVTGLRRLGGPTWGWLAAALTVVVLPPVGTFVVCVWKDVPFVICHVFLLGTLARLVARRRDGPLFSRPLFWAALVELTLICLFRQNGFLVVAIVAALVAPLVRGAAVRILLAGVAAASVALLTNWLLLPTLGVRDSDSIVAYEAFLGDLAIGYAQRPAGFPAADVGLLARVAPLAHWRGSADCHTVDPTVYHVDFDRRVAAEHRDEFLSAWRRLAGRDPGTVLRARVCRGSIAWRPTPAGGLRGNPTAWALPVYLERDPRFDRPAIRKVAYSRPLGEPVAELADRLAGRISGPQWLLWRGATWAYLAYLTVGLVAWLRRDRSLLALAALSLGNQLSVLAVNNAQAARYMAAPFVLGVLLLPLALAGRTPPGPDREGPERAGDRPGADPSGGPASSGGWSALRVTDLTVGAGAAAAPAGPPATGVAADPGAANPDGSGPAVRVRPGWRSAGRRRRGRSAR
ncbi:hypothetical protein [Plantactinospora sp. CA-290183]|uniref:hypothetical protein n=1 Tax=Plantactinospora sp. CA-290183 TaxID=3240006 RepID=UPI003D94FD65